MSNIAEYFPHREDAAIALLLQEDNADRLTDALVDALDEAFRILSEELACGPLN